MSTSVSNALLNSYSYLEYRKLVIDLITEGKSTGDEQSQELLDYSILNETRLKRLDKTISVSDENRVALKVLESEYIWLVIAEGWCGDAAQILPILNKMATETDKIELKIVLRDSNPDLMNQYLTNGGKAIPKLIIINTASGEVCNHW